MRIKRAFMSASALALLVAFSFFGSVSGAAAMPATKGGETDVTTPPEIRVHFVGRVDAVSDRGVLMTTRRGQVRVLVNEDTTILVTRDGGCVEGTLRGLRVGGPAEVFGVTTREPGVVLARGIRQCRPADGNEVD